MTSLAHRPGERILDIQFSDDALTAQLADGRAITVPLAWYPRLLHASEQERRNWQLAGGGFGVHWPDVDEDLSSEGMLRGAPAAPNRKSGAA